MFAFLCTLNKVINTEISLINVYNRGQMISKQRVRGVKVICRGEIFTQKIGYKVTVIYFAENVIHLSYDTVCCNRNQKFTLMSCHEK